MAVHRPYLPPYWALGFHLCRWGYSSTNATRAVNDNLTKYRIPQDVQWNDIDYMDSHYDFTLDPANYADLPQFVDHLHTRKSQRYVLIVDPGEAVLLCCVSGYVHALMCVCACICMCVCVCLYVCACVGVY